MSSSGPQSGFGFITRGDDRWSSIGAALSAGIIGVIFGWFTQVTNAIVAIMNVFIQPVDALASGSADLLGGFFAGMTAILEQAAETTVQSIAPLGAWAVGPLTWIFGILIIGGGLYAMAFVLAQDATSDTLPGTFTDIPFIGVDEEDETEG